jgi:hemerythrin superfamily protein
MDAITLLKNDHQTVEKLFKRFEDTGDRALVERRTIVDKIIEELSQHAAIEEQLFYPVTRATVSDVDDDVLEAIEEHHVVKWLLDELEHMDPSDERFKAKATVLIENVRHHVTEEEDDYFPKVRAALGRNDLNDLGDAMEDAKKTAPTHPHPKAPDTPPGNVIAGAAAGMVDRVTDTVSGLAQGGVSAAQDLIARFTGRSKPRTSPTGSSTARKTAAKVRTAAAEATEKAARTGEATVKSLSNGASDTVSAAKGASTSTGRAAAAGAKQTSAAGTAAADATAATAKTARAGARRTAFTATGAAKKTAKTAKAGAKRTASTATGAAKKTAKTARAGAKRTASTTSA